MGLTEREHVSTSLPRAESQGRFADLKQRIFVDFVDRIVRSSSPEIVELYIVLSFSSDI